jgi:COP9 signalosome complex subunit 1
MGNEELGRHLESTGDLRQALEAYQRMSPDLTTTKQFVEAGKLRSKIHLQMRDWINVGTSLNKLSDCFDDGEEDDKGFRPYYQIVTGLSLLETDKYAEAVQYFLNIDPAVPATHYADVASPNDIAIYGGLLALATMERAALQKVLETSVHFRAFLVLEPHLRKAISHFVNGRYSACLQILESYRPDYLLDLYLQKHVAKIYNKIRHKCLIHYLKPFSRVDLRSMDAFGTPGSSIEADLVGMIRSGALQARINKIDNVVTMAPVNPRLQIQTKTLETVQNYEKDALDRLRRMSILAAELEVKGQRKQPVGAQSSEGDPVYADIMASS